MKVILEKDISGLGKKGELVEASGGHARNYLIPRGLAKKANDKNVNNFKQRKKAKKRKEERGLEEAQEKARELKGHIFELKVKAGEGGRLFGSVTSSDIADKIKEVTGEKIDKRKIELSRNIRTLGVQKVNIKLYKGVTVDINVKVVQA